MKHKTSVVDIHKVKGKRPQFDVYIGRRIRHHNEATRDLREWWYGDSKWCNPYLSLPEYEKLMRKRIKIAPDYWNLEELRGKILGDWCITTDKLEPLVCHGQVLMKLLMEKGD